MSLIPSNFSVKTFNKNSSSLLKTLINSGVIDSSIKEVNNLFSSQKHKKLTNDQKLSFYLYKIIYLSVETTFYENFLNDVKVHNTDLKNQVLTFQSNKPTLNKVIENISDTHFNYITELGECSGCTHCFHHSEVDELISPWLDSDIHFFKNLLKNMITISNSHQYFVNSVLKTPQILTLINLNSILLLRKEIVQHLEKNL